MDPTKLDPDHQLYDNLKSADYQIDSAQEDLQEALAQAKQLATQAGGDAASAIQKVAKAIDASGESLGNTEHVAATFADYKKEFAAQDDRRLQNIEFAAKALVKLDEASKTLEDLQANVPADRKKPLQDLVDNVNDASDNLTEAIKAMGGKAP